MAEAQTCAAGECVWPGLVRHASDLRLEGSGQVAQDKEAEVAALVVGEGEDSWQRAETDSATKHDREAQKCTTGMQKLHRLPI